MQVMKLQDMLIEIDRMVNVRELDAVLHRRARIPEAVSVHFEVAPKLGDKLFIVSHCAAALTDNLALDKPIFLGLSHDFVENAVLVVLFVKVRNVFSAISAEVTEVRLSPD